MNYCFIIAQLIGFIAWIIIIISYYRKNTNAILLFHMLATILFGIHYYLLDANSGFIICIFELFRDFLYYKSDKDDYIFLFSTFFYVIAIIFSFDGIISVFPFFASFFDGFFLTKTKKIVIIGSVVVYILWFVYDIVVKSYTGIFFDLVLVISNILILLFNYNIFKNNNNQSVIIKR